MGVGEGGEVCPREREKHEEVSGDDKRCDAVLSSSQVPKKKVEGRSSKEMKVASVGLCVS